MHADHAAIPWCLGKSELCTFPSNNKYKLQCYKKKLIDSSGILMELYEETKKTI
jgi:hypothetical protein